MTVQGPRLRSLATLLASYFMFGLYWGVWVVVFADFLADHDLTEGQAGLLLAALSVCSILTMTLVSPRLQRLGPARTVPLGHLAMGLGAVLLAAAPGRLTILGFVVIGVGNGLLDVFVNVAGQMVETREHRPVLQFVHAAYNVGGIVGALGAGIALVAGAPFRTPLIIAAAAFGTAGVWCALSPWLRAQPAPTAPETKVSLAVFRRSRALIVPAIVVLSAFAVEGSMDIWSVIYVRDELAATAMTGAIAFALFSFSMASGRLFAGRLLFGLGYRRTIRISGIGSLAAGLAAALAPSAILAGIAFLFLGLFIASAAPAAFGLVSDIDEDPALAIAGMTTVGYSGFVVGPPVMGWLAQTAGLRATMLVIGLMSVGVFAGGILGPAPHPAETPPAR